MPAGSEVDRCPSALLVLLFPLRSGPSSQAAVVLVLPHRPLGDSGDQGARCTLRGIEERTGVSFCSEETAMSPTPNVGFYNTAVLYGLGLHWEWTLPHSFQTGIPWRVTFWVPSHWVREVHNCSRGLLPPLPVPLPVNAFVYCVCVCVCVCVRAPLMLLSFGH